jgi:NO-binding membrane sensor protein with MHYT domain
MGLHLLQLVPVIRPIAWHVRMIRLDEHSVQLSVNRSQAPLLVMTVPVIPMHLVAMATVVVIPQNVHRIRTMRHLTT